MNDFAPLVNLKYADTAIIPHHLSYEENPDSLYKCIGGEIVKLEYLAKYYIDKQADCEMLEDECQNLYSLSYAIMRSVWHKRRPDLPLNIWHKVKMHKQV